MKQFYTFAVRDIFISISYHLYIYYYLFFLQKNFSRLLKQIMLHTRHYGHTIRESGSDARITAS